MPTLRALALLIALLVSVLPVRGDEDPRLPDAQSTGRGALEGTASDFRSFVDEWQAAGWDVSKAARVEGLEITRDSARIELDGWLFLKEGVRGTAARARFFGSGRFRMTPPIPMERQQVRRFTGAETVDEAFGAAEFLCADADGLRLLGALDWSEDEVVKAAEANESARSFVASVENARRGPGVAAEEREQALYSSYFEALDVYERALHSGMPGAFEATMTLDLRGERDPSRSQLVGLRFDDRPEQFEGTSLVGAWDHGNEIASSLITRFSRSHLYDDGLAFAATSRTLESRDTERLDLVHADLWLALDPHKPGDATLRAHQRIVVRAPEVKMITMRISPHMKATSATVAGEPVGFVQPEVPGRRWLQAPAIAIFLPETAQRGDVLELSLEMEGSLLVDHDGGATWIVKAEDDWFPRPDTGGLDGVSSTFDTTITVPRKFSAVSNGAVTKCREEDRMATPGECFRFATKHPIDFPFFNVFKSVHVEAGESPRGSSVAVHASKEGRLVKMAPELLAQSVAALTIYENWFGEFPYARLAVTPHPKRHGRGSAGMLLLWERAFRTPSARQVSHTGEPVPAERWYESFVAHEVAHQWWGNAVGIRSDRDQWFSEGFANYGAVIYLEAIDQARGRGRKALMAEIGDWHEFLTRDAGHVNTIAPLCLANRVSSAENRAGFEDVRQPYMYGKGGYVLHMLRTVARALKGDPQHGDELFKTAVRDFIAAHFLGHPSNLDLLRSFSQSYGLDLGWFFRQWVYGTGIPRAEFSHHLTTGADGQVLLRGRIRQPETDFVFPVAIALRSRKSEGADAPYFYTWVRQADQRFEVALPAAPDEVTINDDLGVLAIFETVPWEATPSERPGQ